MLGRTESTLVYVPCFNRMSEWTRQFVFDLFDTETHEERRFICHEGDESRGFYVVTQGTVRAAVTDPEDGGERELAVHEKGGFFDEAALVTDGLLRIIVT